MTQQTATEPREVSLSVKYTKLAYSRNEESLESGTEAFQMCRDLSCFGPRAFSARGISLEKALETAYATIVDDVTVEVNEGIEVFLEHIYARMQGPAVDDELGYDGSELRSMQTGDIIVIDDEHYMVDRRGFKNIEKYSHE